MDLYGSTAELIRLYTGELAEYKRADIPYVSHITLGAFTREPARLAQGLAEASTMHLECSTLVDRLNLVKINAGARRWFGISSSY